MTTAARPSRAARFARNTVWNLLGQAGGVAIAFFVTPYLVDRLGTEAYGLYILLHVISSYLIMFSFSSGTAVVKHVSEFLAAGDTGALRRTLRYAASITVLGVLAGSAAVFLGADRLAAGLLHVPAVLHGQGVWVVRCAAMGALFFALFQLVGAALQGLQRFDLSNMLNFAQNSLMTLGAAALVYCGLRLDAVAAWFVLINVTIAAAALFFVRRHLAGPLSAQPRSRSRFGFRAFSAYAFSLWLGQVAWALTFQFDRLLIGAQVSLNDLTLYGVPAGVMQRLQVLPAAVAIVLIPMMSELRGEQNRETLHRMYLKSMRIILWTVLPAMVLLFALMPQFLSLWLGAEFGTRGVWPARLLVVAQTLLLLYYVPNTASAARGKPLYFSGALWAQAIVSLAAWWVMIPLYGILGAAIGALLAQALPLIPYLSIVHRKIVRISWGRFLTEGLYAPFVSASLLLLVVFPIHHLVCTWVRFVVCVAASLMLYYGSTWVLLQPDEREFLRGFLRSSVLNRLRV